MQFNYACGFIFNNFYLKSLTNYFKIKHVKLAMYLILHVVLSLIIFILSVSQITYVLAVEPEKLLSKLDVLNKYPSLPSYVCTVPKLFFAHSFSHIHTMFI